MGMEQQPAKPAEEAGPRIIQLSQAGFVPAPGPRPAPVIAAPAVLPVAVKK